MDDIRMLADSVRSKFETLHPLSNGCCIYRVPKSWRCLHPNDYTPKMVSIGPLHHGNEELKAMEEHKLRYLRCFLQQRTKVSVEDFLTFIKVKEAELRNCYEETIAFNSDDFATMIFVDAIFLLEFFLRGFRGDFTTSDDRIYGKPRLIDQLIGDLWLLENQLPLFILDELFDLAKAATYGDYYEGLSLFRISYWFWRSGFPNFPIDKDLLDTKFSEAEHFLDLPRLCLQPPQSRVQIEFRRIIKIPFVTIYDDTESFYRNVLAFERMHGYTRYLNDYIIIMSYLAHTPEDGKLLIQNGIVGLGNSERLSNFFLSHIKECLMGRGFGYTNLVEDLQSYCKSPWHSWKANLRQNYFNTPWASISVAGAVILLVLTLIQTACSVIGL
ncbi:hypothetical protein WN944_009398 [Citrus x changshan-huyou]|uniref:Uncharacterized protein n=1 Tax=Citrus x changshan-huyou TaxID=2935761 RepID=A0AAP0MRN5_9ROSI